MAKRQFSKDFSTYNKWLKAQKDKNKPYVKRVIRFMEKYPKATLKQAYGHSERLERGKTASQLEGLRKMAKGKFLAKEKTVSKRKDVFIGKSRTVFIILKPQPVIEKAEFGEIQEMQIIKESLYQDLLIQSIKKKMNKVFKERLTKRKGSLFQMWILAKIEDLDLGIEEKYIFTSMEAKMEYSEALELLVHAIIDKFEKYSINKMTFKELGIKFYYG